MSDCSFVDLFQFTPLREGRHKQTRKQVYSLFISIHAPAGGATPADTAAVWPCYFNSRPCGRGDPCDEVLIIRHIYFNSRPCGRGDAPRPARTAPPSNFNSRPCGRGDHAWAPPMRALYISIHAPAGGATEIAGKISLLQNPFQFTPLREGRHHDELLRQTRKNFNSRPCGRGD
mgnify:CR=1 FL=1